MVLKMFILNIFDMFFFLLFTDAARLKTFLKIKVTNLNYCQKL